MTRNPLEGNPRVRLPIEVRELADRLASALTYYERAKRNDWRPLSAGRALCLLLAMHGHLPMPTDRHDLDRICEIRRILQQEAVEVVEA